MRAVLDLRYRVPQSERDEAFPVLLAAAKDSDPQVRFSAARALAGRPDRSAEVLPILRGLVKDPSQEVRECAILELKSFVKPGSAEVYTVLPDLVAALDDAKPSVRLLAARALDVYGLLKAEAKHFVPAMARLIREETGIYRLDALYFLNMHKMVPEDLEPTLRGLLTANIPNERIQAKLALILLGVSDQDHDAMIKSMLESPHLEERLAVGDFLVQLGMREMGIQALKNLAQSDDPGIRARAQKLLWTYNSGDEDL
jgi:HEAT repeat protein